MTDSRGIFKVFFLNPEVSATRRLVSHGVSIGIRGFGIEKSALASGKWCFSSLDNCPDGNTDGLSTELFCMGIGIAS